TGDSLRVYRVSGAPSESNPPEGCLAAPKRGSAYESPSWSPGGDGLAWSDESGIYVAAVPGLAAACPVAGSIKVQQIAPGGRHPDRGPAGPPGPAPPPGRPRAAATRPARPGPSEAVRHRRQGPDREGRRPRRRHALGDRQEGRPRRRYGLRAQGEGRH